MARIVRWLPVAIVIALLGAAMVAATYADLGVERLRGDGPDTTQVSPPPEPEEERLPPEQGDPDAGEPYALPAWLGYLVSGLCIAMVLGLVGALIWATLRDKLGIRRAVPTVVDPEELRRQSQEQVRAAVDEGLADLDEADADPRRAVIACWVRLERAAAAAGSAREPGDTSTELVQRLLAAHAITAPVLAGLAEVYREARFGTHDVDVAMRERARAALLQVRDELMGTVGAREDPPGTVGAREDTEGTVGARDE